MYIFTADIRYRRRQRVTGRAYNLIAEALANRTDAGALERVRQKVQELTRRFPLPA